MRRYGPRSGCRARKPSPAAVSLPDTDVLTRILFVAAEDWLFALRHLPAIRAALELGFEPVVAAPASGSQNTIIRSGARFVPLKRPRGRLVAALWRQVAELRVLLAREAPALVQLHGPRAALAGEIACRLAGQQRRAMAFSGLGGIARQGGLPGEAARALARLAAGAIASQGATGLIFDNSDDAALLGLEPGASGMTILGGAGIDPVQHMPEPMPWSPPLRLVFGSPLLHANGPDLAVEAVSRARAAGADARLSLIGAALSGRGAVPGATLAAWSRLPGIAWYGPTADIAEVWRQHHALVLPSRGGDGLPPLLGLAAAAGRPILTSDAAGCGSFVRDGIDGRVTPVGDVAALADAIGLLARAPGLVERMGRASREKLMAGYTERDVINGLKTAWRGMLAVEAIA